jgi:hypothetical protein
MHFKTQLQVSHVIIDFPLNWITDKQTYTCKFSYCINSD